MRPVLKRFLFGSAALAFAATGVFARAENVSAGKDMLLQADSAVYDDKAKTWTAKGHVEIDYDGRILLADSVTYHQDSDVVTAQGHVSLLDKTGNVAFAEHVVLKDKMRDGAIQGFGALLGGHARMVAASAERKEGRYTIARHVAYTPCKICNKPGERTPTWQIRADKVEHDQEQHRIKFKNATIQALGVPVFYTPYFAEPDPTVRYASGFLMPDVGSSSSIGYYITLPYYWSMSKSRDATIEPVFTTRGGQVLQGEYRQRWNDGGMWLQGSVAHNPRGGTSTHLTQYYAHLFGSGRGAIDDTWSFGYDAQIASNDTYLKRYNISQLDRLMSDLFISGEQGRSRLMVAGYFFQGLRASDNNRTFPVPLPLIEYTYIPMQKVVGGRFRFDINSVVLTRDIGTNDQRLTAEANWRLPAVSGNGMLWTFALDARGDVYHTDYAGSYQSGDAYADPGTNKSKSIFKARGLPYAALDWRWPFINSVGSRAVVLEPIVQLIAQPYGGNLHGLPNEDSMNVELDDNNLLSFDQVPGNDVVVSGPRANFGLRAETRFESGYAEALLGHAVRLKEDPALAAIPGSGFTGTSSDLIGRFSVKFQPYIDLTNRIDVDEQSGNVRRNETYLTGTYGRNATRISYIELAPTLGLPARQEVNAQIDVNFYRNWQAFAAIRRDMKADQTLDTEFGLGYEDDCLGISLGYHRKYTTDRDLRPSTNFVLRFKLKTTDSPIQPFSLFPEDVFSYGRP
jgi:LPS-assembly protein